MTRVNEYFYAHKATPEQMDFLWAEGWRHFGEYFFRYSHLHTHEGVCHVTPLRITVNDFFLSASQKRVLKKNQDLRVEIRDAFIDEAKEALFHRHKTRFAENVPDSIYDFFSSQPATIPCETKEICLWEGERFLAASFLDVGATAASSVYSIYEPTEAKRSLGIYLILLALAFARQHKKAHYYPGYAYREPSHYDYKKRFAALENFDWKTWQPLKNSE